MTRVGPVAVALLVVAGLACAATLATLPGVRGGDGWDVGWNRSVAILGLGLEWILLAAVAVSRQRLAGLALASLGALGGYLAFRLLTDAFYASRWPLGLAAAGPLLVAIVAVRARGAREAIAAAAALVVVGLAAAGYRAAHRDRDRAARDAAARLAEQAEFDRLDAASPIDAWLSYTSRSDARRPAALAGIRSSPRRQAGIEARLGLGDAETLRDLPEYDLHPTPALCAGALGAVRRLISEWGPEPGGQPRSLARSSLFVQCRGAVRWLVERGCDFRIGLDELDEAIGRFQDTPERRDYEAFLAELRARLPPGRPRR